jgi:small-conductance mechanosensitive channel
VGFWARQGVRLATTVVLGLGLVSIWFDDPTRLATVLGLVTAGLAFALQKVVTAVAGDFVILRGNTFNVGDRITMGGVRGDVIALGFIQTTIMEMGQPPSLAPDADPAMWVRSRQYTGRVVTVSNDRIFNDPVYNYTRDFPYIWEEIRLPISYTADRERAERILMEAAGRHSVPVGELSAEALLQMERRYVMRAADIRPRVYYRLTDNWLELTVRFVVKDHGIREVKDAMSRDIVSDLGAAGIGVASATIEIVGLPPLRVIENIPAASNRLK